MATKKEKKPKRDKKEILDEAVEQLFDGEDLDFDEAGVRGRPVENEKPIRSVPMNDRVEKACIEFQDAILPMKRKMKDLVMELKKEFEKAQVIKSRFWSMVDIEMGLSSAQYRMQINREDGEIEIIEDLFEEKFDSDQE